MISQFLPRKGRLSDAFLVLDHKSPLKSFIANLLEEDAKYSFDEHPNEGLVYFYITEGTQPTKRKKKIQEPYVVKKTPSNQITDEILNKYLPELTSREVLNTSSRLFLIVLYLNPDLFKRYSSLEDLEKHILSIRDEKLKFLMILENVKEWIRAQTLQQNQKVTIEEFNIWLLRMQLDHNIDYCSTTSTKSTSEVLGGCLCSTIQAKYLKNDITFQGGKGLNEEQAKLGGINNTYQMEWISMLLAVHGITESKALAIVQEYPSYKQLMQAYRKTPVENRLNLLSNIQYSMHVDDPHNPDKKRVGPKISERIYILITTNNPDDALFQ